MSSNASPRIAVVLCSSRKPRVCPQVADYVIEILKQMGSQSSTELEHDGPPPADPHTSSARFIPLDLSEINLPMFDEPKIPQQVTNADDYVQPHTRAWSKEVQKYSAFVFVLPQYNWGYPAVLKNAIDYLFNEWNGKPAMIVSYGGHGGTKSAGQLRQVLEAVKMNVVDTMPALTFPGRPVMVKASKGEDIGLNGELGIWEAEKQDIRKGGEEMMAILAKFGV